MKRHPKSGVAPRSILIIRLSAIGDNVMATPLIEAFKIQYPNAKIDWLVQPESKDLVANHSGLNDTIVWPTKHFKKLLKSKKYLTFWKEWRAAIKSIKARKYDWVIDTQGLMKSGMIAWLARPKYIVGLGSREGSQFLVNDNVPKIHGKPRISSEYFDLAEFLDLPTDPFEMKLELSKESYVSVDSIIKEFSLQNGFATVLPFTTRPQKHWVEKNWSDVIDQWFTKTGIPCVILGGPGDRTASDRIVDGVKNKDSVINLAGERFLSIPDAAALIAKAKLSIGVDTGMTHMSVAHKKPTVCIFGSTVPYTETHTPNVRILFEKMDCAPCRKHPTCNGAFTCMNQVTPQLVLDAAMAIISSTGTRS